MMRRVGSLVLLALSACSTRLESGQFLCAQSEPGSCPAGRVREDVTW